MNFKDIKDDWFYSNPWWWTRPFLVYVKGDAIVLVPLTVAILLTALYSIKLAALIYAVYFTIRGLGEMIYWLLQQFGQKTYRPNDFGFKNLSNDAIYIIYQTISLANIIIGIGFILFLCLKN